MVRDALSAGLPLTIYGANWERYVPADVIAGRFVANEDLPTVYSSASVVLNDHWPGMREWGLISNRVFDVLGCGGCLVSDDVSGLKELFGDAVAVADGRDAVELTVNRLLADPAERTRMGRAGRTLVEAGHTFAHRAETFLTATVPAWQATKGR
jgi:spore maturation protein CgeB